jgi:hypothetical protein
MDKQASVDRDALAQLIKDTLSKAERHSSTLRKTNIRLMIVSTTSSALTTLVAGGTAALGPLIGQGIPGWRLACSVAALLAFVTTLTTSLNQQLKLSDKVSQGDQCVRRLRLLHMSLATGASNWEEITKEYDDITRTFPEYIVA